MKQHFVFSVFTAIVLLHPACRLQAQMAGLYHITKTYPIAGAGGWDYIAVGPGNNRLYVSHNNQVNILDEKTGDSVDVISNTTGVHGIAFVQSLNRGYTSNGKLNNISVFDLTSNKVTGQIATGQNPDAIMYEPWSKKIITCNGRSNDLTIIDPRTEKVLTTIAVGGKPETAVSDGAGKIYVNIEDKNEIVVINLTRNIVEQHWSVFPATGPTGLAIDPNTKRLFAGCDKLLVVIDMVSGKITDTIKIGEGCDGVAFDSISKVIFASCGEGKLSIINEDANGNCAFVENIATKKSARTLTVNETLHTVYLPAANMSALSPGEKRAQMIPGTFQVLVVQSR